MSSKQVPRWETYLKQMSRLTLGEALCEPAPLPYFERVQLGDVGYVLGGCFHLLFSAGCPLGERELGADVPRTFKQLVVGPTFSTQPRSPGCLSTNTVREIPGRARGPMYPGMEPGSGTTLQLTGNQGAALLTKYPTYREDIQLGRVFEEYTKEHYDSWVAFARDRGHPNDIKPILVTGVDMTRDFAMISYSNDGDDMTADFTLSAPGVAFPWGNWRAPGVVYTNCGPQPCRPPSSGIRTETISDKYNQCIFVRYYTMRKRLGIPRVIKAAAGPHDLGPRRRDGEKPPLGVEQNSDSGSDMSSVFDGDWDDDGSSITSIDSESDIVVHNPTLDERNEFDTIADYVFQNSDADSVLIHHRDIALLREMGGSADLSTQLNEKRPPITVDRGGVGMLEHKAGSPANSQSDDPIAIPPPTPSFISGEVEHETTNGMAPPKPQLPPRQGNPPQDFPSWTREDAGGSVSKSIRSRLPAWAYRTIMTRSRAIKSLAFVVLSITYTQTLINPKSYVTPLVGLASNLTIGINLDDAVGLTYEGCTAWCGSEQESFDWPAFSQQFSSWLLPWIALISQLPFSAESWLDNLVSIVLTVGSPALAAFSLAHAALNTRWVYNRFSTIKHPNHRNAAKALVYLQQAPLRVTTRGGLLASLIVLPQNDGWWCFLVERLERTHTWTIAAATSIIWAIVAFVFAIVDSFTNPGENPSATGQGVSSLWLWLIPIVIGWLWTPVFSHDELKAAIDGANKLAFVATDVGAPRRTYSTSHRRAIMIPGSTEVFTRDAAQTAPVFNYARIWEWSSVVETIAQGFEEADRNAGRHVPVTSEKEWARLADANRRDDRTRTINQLQAYCGFPVQGGKEPIPPVPSGIWKRIAIASAFALVLQWGTTGSAIISVTFTPVVGLGCRSMSFILYGIVSTMIWLALLLSSCLTHYAKMQYDGDVVPDHGFNSANLAKGFAILLRQLSIFAAGCNALGVVLASTSQFFNSYSTCYCSSSVLGWGSEVVHRIITTGYDQMKGGWIGGIILVCGCVFVFLFFLYLMLEPSRDIHRR